MNFAVFCFRVSMQICKIIKFLCFYYQVTTVDRMSSLGRVVMSDWYIYRWKNNPKRATLCGRKCRVLVRGAMNSALVEFEDGQREVISRNALRRLTSVNVENAH